MAKGKERERKGTGGWAHERKRGHRLSGMVEKEPSSWMRKESLMKE